MKWLWIAFALVWAFSIVLDARRRDRVPRDRPPRREPASRARDTELPACFRQGASRRYRRAAVGMSAMR